jgi:hypothetical protein
VRAAAEDGEGNETRVSRNTTWAIYMIALIWAKVPILGLFRPMTRVGS